MRKTKRNYNRNVEKDHDFFFSVSDTGGIIHLHTQLIQVRTGLLLRFKHFKVSSFKAMRL